MSVNPRIPDVAGELVGFRAWLVDVEQREPRLVSPAVETIWTPRDWTHAECGYGCDVPGEQHSCGIYAALHRARLVGLGYSRYDDELRVIGEVGLAGKVIPATCGYRAEKARPIQLWLPYERWRLARPLARAYGVPVGLTNLFKAAA